jgi:hypothetical protein
MSGLPKTRQGRPPLRTAHAWRYFAHDSTKYICDRGAYARSINASAHALRSLKSLNPLEFKPFATFCLIGRTPLTEARKGRKEEVSRTFSVRKKVCTIDATLHHAFAQDDLRRIAVAAAQPNSANPSPPGSGTAPAAGTAMALKPKSVLHSVRSAPLTVPFPSASP